MVIEKQNAAPNTAKMGKSGKELGTKERRHESRKPFPARTMTPKNPRIIPMILRAEMVCPFTKRPSMIVANKGTVPIKIAVTLLGS